ncbi:hypothetical protein [uncultured Dokdonia sp.]|uniref:hypothetical protein n=1 Tax=uncultured Dokdonia sp. TaxID=575653 RepID=UPI00262539B3|nr:hypothetical protein [uncultured Dokdonia sp.]
MSSSFKLSNTAYNELIDILKRQMNKDIFESLSPEDIHHIGFHLLTVTNIQLRLAIKKEKLALIDRTHDLS